jgi:O-antigen/teichoic acid export membrane protein
MSESANNKRIAKNTLFLYFRTIVIMLITLYTSRIILNVLGVQDYGIYNVVGGVVAMFGVISGALSSSISRFITFELGKGNTDRINKIFSSSINIQFGIALFVIAIGELVGLWFLNYKMNIPPDRLEAANWVLQCSLLAFCIKLVSVPYNACIIAHEKMKAFAYVSILEALLKLGVCFLISISTIDKLVSYSTLLVGVAICIRSTYTIYCHRHFEESHYHFVFDKTILKEMTGFAGWNFFTNGAYIFNTQGVNILINLFFGVTINAARGIATQVDHAVMQLVNSFTTALNPQITKNYAAGNINAMFTLVCRGAKFSFFLLFVFALPVLMETEYILTIWLKIVPPHAVNFVRLAIVASMIHIIGKTGYTAVMATGQIKWYVIWITTVGFLVFPLTWLAFELGAPSESTYIVFIVVYIAVEITRLWIMKGQLHFPVSVFIKEVIVKIILVTLLSMIFPIIFIHCIETSLLRTIISIIICLISATTSIYLFGLTASERLQIVKMAKDKLHI